MDALAQAALLGTARATTTSSDTPAGALVARLSGTDPERALLLRAGTEAIYREAGSQLTALTSTVEPAPSEMLPACSLSTARLFRDMFADVHKEVLPQALTRLRDASLRLPHELLPSALSQSSHQVRQELPPVLGARGLWLRQFNSAWRWTSEMLADSQPIPDDAERRWQRGRSAERLALLRRIRMDDPERARVLLESTWKKDKADFRAKAIEILGTNRSLGDESFLEIALDDRAEDVQWQVTKVLRIPGSAFVERMTRRADVILTCADPEDTLSVRPASEFDPAWQRDGITEAPPLDFVGKRAWWLIQILACVPPSHWQTRFGVPPETLIQAVQQNEEWGAIVVDGWIRATTAFRDPEWALPLWKWAFAASAPTSTRHYRFFNSMFYLRDLLPPSVADQLLIQHLREISIDDVRWVSIMEGLLGPWSVEIGTLYLNALRDQYADATIQSDGSYLWFRTLANAALALPSECFAQALEEWIPREPEDANLARWHRSHWERTIPPFMETIRFRQRVVKEIPL